MLAAPLLSSEMDVQHQEWESSIYYNETDYFVAATDHTGKHGDISLFVARAIKDCDMWDVSLTIDGRHIAPQDYESDLMNAQLRIDSNTVHTIDYLLSFEEDESSFFIELIEPNDREDVFSEIDHGKRLRIQLNILGEEYTLGFPLQGAQEAIERTKLLCAKHIPDDDYFSGSAKKMPNEQLVL